MTTLFAGESVLEYYNRLAESLLGEGRQDVSLPLALRRTLRSLFS